MEIRNAHHLLGLDLVRFVAASAVMLYHFVFWKNGNIPKPEGVAWREIWFAWVGVEIFFTLSGFVIAFSAEKSAPLSFAKSRLLRLMPGIWICGTLTFLTALALSDIGTTQLIKQYLSTMVMLPIGHHIDVVYWTLTVELAFYFLVFLCIRLLNFQAMVWIIVGVGLLSVFYNITSFAIANGYDKDLGQTVSGCITFLNGKTFSRLLLLEHGCYFSVGVLLKYILSKPKVKVFIIRILFLFLLTGSMASLHIYSLKYIDRNALNEMSPATPTVVWLLSVSIIAGSVYLQKPLERLGDRAKSFVRFLGLSTYPLYLIHNTNGLLIIGWLEKTGLSAATRITIATIMVLAATAIITLYLEPYLREKLHPLADRLFGKSRISTNKGAL